MNVWKREILHVQEWDYGNRNGITEWDHGNGIIGMGVWKWNHGGMGM